MSKTKTATSPPHHTQPVGTITKVTGELRSKPGNMYGTCKQTKVKIVPQLPQTSVYRCSFTVQWTAALSVNHFLYQLDQCICTLVICGYVLSDLQFCPPTPIKHCLLNNNNGEFLSVSLLLGTRGAYNVYKIYMEHKKKIL